jgi:biotin carboxyl carrier protein
MKLQIKLDGRTRTVEIGRTGEKANYTIDDKPIDADATQISTGVYSVLIGGDSYEVHVEKRGAGIQVHVSGQEITAERIDPRKWRRSGGGVETDGKQQVVASMPGKVVRVFVKPGEAVESGQGLGVIEAMKMQNEIRSPKSGTVERLLISIGQTVNAGDILAVIA